MGKNVIFDIDVSGGLRLKRKFPDQTLAIFIKPPSIDDLKIRLKKRKTETTDKINMRISKASAELATAPLFDCIIVNDILEQAQQAAYEKVKTFVFKFKDDLVGFFELIFHQEKNEIEIAYFGILKEYQNKKLGSYLLTEAIKKSFENKVNRVWVHTCSLDHKNALRNYISRGMKIFKKEILTV